MAMHNKAISGHGMSHLSYTAGCGKLDVPQLVAPSAPVSDLCTETSAASAAACLFVPTETFDFERIILCYAHNVYFSDF